MFNLYFVLISSLIWLFLSGCDNLYLNNSAGNSYSSNNQQTGYYREYVGQVEWIIVAPGTINSNQTDWVEYPAALLRYQIPGYWARVSSNTVALSHKLPS